MKILSRDHKHLNSYLMEASYLIGKETQRLIPDGAPKEFLYDLMHDYPLRGGKRFRPAMVLLCCELFGGNSEDAINTATALELFHNFALIHDDIEDNSIIRRGAPTLHLKYGTALAINSGDAMFGLVHDILLNNHSILNGDLSLKLHKYINKVMMTTFEGQAIDIGWIENQIFPTKIEYIEMIIKKTGCYSGSGPCKCGAMIAGASKSELENIGIFGEAIGVGFQILDDLLNLTENNELNAPTAGSGGYGKERGGDISEGKRTLITIELFDRLSQTKADKLKHILTKNRKNVSNDEIEWCIDNANSSGAIKAVSNYCLNQVEFATSALNKLPNNSAKDLLRELISYLTIERKA